MILYSRRSFFTKSGKKLMKFDCGIFGLFGEKTEIKICSNNLEQTRMPWNYEDSILGPTKNRTFDRDDWTYDNYRECRTRRF
jgi:hypothetical protein